MPSPAAVHAAAVAGWLLAAVGLGLSLPAEGNSETGFSLCSHCFYRQTPPRGASAGAPLLRPLCHSLPGGRAFAALHNPTCDTAVYFAFRLGHGWAERGGEEEGEMVTENKEDGVQVLVPALLRGGGSPSRLSLPEDSPLARWDSSVAALVSSSIAPRCGSSGGDLYVLTGAVGDEECEAKLLWSAVCCASSEGEGGLSVGLVRETGEGERAVSVKELEEMLGVAELFSDGCGGTDGATAGGLRGEAFSGNVETLESDTTGQDSDENDREDVEAKVAGEEAAGVDAQPEKAQVADVTVTSESAGEEQGDVTHSGAVGSESGQSSDDYETAAALESDTDSNSTLVYIISSTFSILTLPLRPVVSTITQLPGQVTYVLQEDLGVLCALPGDTFSLFHLVASDLASGVGSAADMLLGLGESCFSGLYSFTSCVLGALLNSCQTGVTGMGTLAGDTVGIFGEAADNAWWVTRFFGERLWEQSEGYVGTVVSEMGGQTKAVGGGLGDLAWRGGRFMGNVVRAGGGLIVGTVEMTFNVVWEVFAPESDWWEENQTPIAQ